jgi:hypothetical protein
MVDENILFAMETRKLPGFTVCRVRNGNVFK